MGRRPAGRPEALLRVALFIGNRFEKGNGGIYMQAADQVVKTVCTQPEVRCVSLKEMADWLDTQSPAVLAKLRDLDRGKAPDWSTFIRRAERFGDFRGDADARAMSAGF